MTWFVKEINTYLDVSEFLYLQMFVLFIVASISNFSLLHQCQWCAQILQLISANNLSTHFYGEKCDFYLFFEKLIFSLIEKEVNTF